MPIAFVFRVRANQEYAVLAGLLFALYATERARERPVWTAGMIAGFSAVLLVKGVFALMVPLVCALWLIARGRNLDDHLRRAPAWLGVVLMPIAGALVIWLYETAYRHVTGQSFIEIYRTKQVPEGALVAGSVLYRVAYTGAWYFSRIVWYGLPWSVPALFMLARQLRHGHWWPWHGRSSPDDDRSLARQGAWFALVAGLALAAGFSLAHRKADRYIFPVYFLIGAAGAAAAVRRVPRLARLVDRLDHPWAAPAIYVALTVLTLATSGRHPCPRSGGRERAREAQGSRFGGCRELRQGGSQHSSRLTARATWRMASGSRCVAVVGLSRFAPAGQISLAPAGVTVVP